MSRRMILPTSSTTPPPPPPLLPTTTTQLLITFNVALWKHCALPRAAPGRGRGGQLTLHRQTTTKTTTTTDEMPQVVKPSSYPGPRDNEGELNFSLSNNYQTDYYDASEAYITEGWNTAATAGWLMPQQDWIPTDSFPIASRSREDPSLYVPVPGSAARDQYVPLPYEAVPVPNVYGIQQHPSRVQPQLPQVLPSSTGADYQFQTPEDQSSGYASFESLGPHHHHNHHPHAHTYPDDISPPAFQVQEWSTPYLSNGIDNMPLMSNSSDPTVPEPSLSPASTHQPTVQFHDESSAYFASEEKKKPAQRPVKKRTRVLTPDPEPDINEFVVVFETAPGALANVKRRRKLDAPVRKAAKEVRKAGACHQCRFRRRTCSTGTPCNSCIKNGNGLQELKCQRESPFVGKLMHGYFEHSSKKRVVSFNIKSSSLKSLPSASSIKVTIDGIGRHSHPLEIPALTELFENFSLEDKAMIRQTEGEEKANNTKAAGSNSVIIIDDGFALAIEQWAVEYSSKFVHAAGPEFYSTTMAQILGTAYVKKKLPESELVAAMLRLASIAFVLRAGVKYTCKGTSPSRYRTVQAKVDSILFQRLRLAEEDMYRMLQKLIFRSAGSLRREQIYPVALVLWQLLRILSLSASHLANIVQRFQASASGPAEYHLLGLKLVISTHLALFRSSNPLLLDMTDPFHQDLLQKDPELIKLAVKMRKVVMNFRDKGFPELKGSIAYRKEMFDYFRKVYGGK
ncbi:hypothetical protein PVAG01_08423 [Phlyctema vagabunda]|uniref:Zn(2)-C6 fungal-type domain-containing protein n=1 Tax=Phlyctema vagabunda TaxID=108571 RepID=A0ABR4P9F0_9HELO